ncbi:chemotaxis protein CheW [Lysobacter humi (ex Lee et al. 2017)]
MSKKKRNRRPAPAPAPTASPGSTAPSLDAVLEEMSEDIAAEAQADAEIHAAAAPVVEAALAQAASADRSQRAHAAPVAVDAPQDAPPTPALVPSWATHESGDIRGVLIQVAGGRLLLPNATIAEVLSYAEPEREADAADWMLGRLRWRGWSLPLVAFSQFAGLGQERPGFGSKVIVLKALGGDRRLPFFAVLTQGFPRLVTVSRAALEVEAAEGELPAGVQALVRLNDEPALLPDLLQIEAKLREAREARDAA